MVHKRVKPRREVFECQHCGADVPVGAAACRECGSDAGTGWQSAEEIDYQSLDLPERDVADTGAVVHGPRRPLWLVVVALVLVAALLALALLRR
jgi:hypothetical protein